MKTTNDTFLNPWKTVASTKVYDNPWIYVREDKVINPGGGDGIYGVVHFKNYAIGIIPVDADGFTWIVGQYRYSLNEYSWEIPMGGSPRNTSPLEGGMRELREETGITASRWTELMKLHTSNSVTDEVGTVFVATDLTIGEWEPEETEQLTIRRLPFQEVVTMVINNSITDCISVAAILRLNVALNSGEIVF